jgi:spore coat protein U-like protein
MSLLKSAPTTIAAMAKTNARKVVTAGGLAICLLAGVNQTPAHATTATATIAVSATVLSFCSISATALAFGNYSTTAVSGTASVTTTCTTGTTFNVGLDVGTGTGATVATRKMTNGANTLGYSLYSDSGHTTVWGPTIGTNTQAGTGTGIAQTLTVYGLIPASEYVAPGSYTDTVTATITY